MKLKETRELVRALHEWYVAATDGKHVNTGPSPYAQLFDDETSLVEKIERAGKELGALN